MSIWVSPGWPSFLPSGCPQLARAQYASRGGITNAPQTLAVILSSGTLNCHGTPRFNRKMLTGNCGTHALLHRGNPPKAGGAVRGSCLVVITVSTRWRSRL